MRAVALTLAATALFSAAQATPVVKRADCGDRGQQDESSAGAGPNGSEAYFNCGISQDDPDSGWTPPSLTLDDLQLASLDDHTGDTYSQCADFVQFFKNSAEKYNLSPIILAAIAQQESSCNPDAVGDGGGAFGLMQIIQENCDGAPDGNCSDPEFNVDRGASEFRRHLDDNNGNVLLGLGEYNGWYNGLTYNNVLDLKNNQCCECQQNLDYLQQNLNGWFLGINAYDAGLGTERNLDSCGGQRKSVARYGLTPSS